MTETRYLLLRFSNEVPSDRMTAIRSNMSDIGLFYHVLDDRLALFTQRPVRSFSAEYGFLLGRAYYRDLPYARYSQAALPAGAPMAGLDSLCREAWGDYVAIASHNDGSAHIFRSPMGRLACYFAAGPGWTAAASDVAILRRTGLLNPTIDWSYVAEHLHAPHFRPPRTALSGVVELLGGQCLVMRSGRPTTETVWSPWDVALEYKGRADGYGPASHIRTVVAATVRAMARDHGKVLLGVSGGLDSSIVAACLASAGHDHCLMTLATEDPRGDERLYARVLASHLGSPLIEEIDTPEGIDLTRSDAAELPRPVARSFAQSGDRIMLDVARRVGANVFFSGGGGDNVFCFLQSASPIADRFLSSHWFGAVRTATDMAKITGASIPHAFDLGFRRAYLRRRRFRWPTEVGYLSRNALDLAGKYRDHPWLTVPKGGLPGKAAHIASLIGIENHLEGFGRQKHHPLISPLIALPVAEACLAVPSWSWCAGGINRSLARRAFSDLLPAQILQRTGKGTPDGLAARLYDQSRPILREMLLGGALATQKLIRTNEIERDLAEGVPLVGERYSRILELVDVEAWLRAQ